MVPWPFDQALPRSGGKESLDSQFKIVAGAFLELFGLLEEYAPIWFTEQHHQRALTAWRILQKPSGKPVSVESLDKRDAARQKPSANPIVVAGHSAQDSTVKARKAADKLDRDYEANRVRQDKIEQRPDPQKGD